MKKIYLMLLVLFIFVFAGCTKQQPPKEQVTLRLATWVYTGTPTSQERYPMYWAVKEFERLNPHIKVEILRAPMVPNNDETGTVPQPWLDFLASLAATNQFPDVFNAPNMPNVLQMGWARNITDLTEQDDEFELMYEDFRKSGEFFDQQFAIPFMYEFFGYFINKTLFDELNADYPTFGFTIDDMIASSKSIARLQEGGNSILGMSGPAEMFNYMPAQINSSLGWYAYNSVTNQFELNGAAFRQAIEYNLQIFRDSSHVNDALTDSERALYFGTTDWWFPWWNNRMGIHFDFSVMFTNLLNAKKNGEITFDFDFIGIPRGTSAEESRTPVKPSYFMLGKNTQHPEEAYELAKWLSFSPDGYEYRMQVSRDFDDVLPIISPPLTTDAKAHKAFFEDTYPDFPEWRKVIEAGNFYFDLWAVMPGFEEARWLMTYQEGVTMADINYQIGTAGTEAIGDHAQEMMRLMNNKIAEVYARLRTTLEIDG